MEAWSAPSPDGQWLAQGLMEGPFLAEDGSEKYHTRLEVVSTTGNISWTLVDKTSNFGLGYTVPKPFEWSSNGRYLYFTHEGVPDGCALFTNGSDLYRGDLTNGQVTEIVSPWVWGISLSPDEKTVATIAWNGEVLELAARDLATGDERRTGLEPKYSQAGGIIWSPDGKTIMLTLATNPCDPARWVQSIARVDLATLTPTILIPDDRRLFTTVEWPETNKVLLTDQAGDLWAMVPMTGELEKIAN